MAPEITGGVFAFGPLPDGAAATLMLNGPTEALSVPSDTEMVIPLYWPTLAALGVPLSLPVVASNVAHVGMFAMLKVSVLPFASLAVGVEA